eukprot:6183178-Pleurochrysis_carterae.AAC.1
MHTTAECSDSGPVDVYLSHSLSLSFPCCAFSPASLILAPSLDFLAPSFTQFIDEHVLSIKTKGGGFCLKLCHLLILKVLDEVSIMKRVQTGFT